MFCVGVLLSSSSHPHRFVGGQKQMFVQEPGKVGLIFGAWVPLNVAAAAARGRKLCLVSPIYVYYTFYLGAGFIVN